MELINCDLYETKILLAAFFLLSIFTGFSQNLRAYLSYSTFNTPANEPYLETYLSINGSSIKYVKTNDGKYQGTIDVQIIFKIGNSIFNYANYDLSSPIINDNLENNVNMIDLQRYLLPAGDYNVEISLKDINSTNKKLRSYDKFSIVLPADRIAIDTYICLGNEEYELGKFPQLQFTLILQKQNYTSNTILQLTTIKLKLKYLIALVY